MDLSKTATLSYQKQSYQASMALQKNNKGDGSEAYQINANMQVSSMSVSLSIQDVNQSMSLIYSKAIESLNIELEATYGENAIQKAYDEGIDFSPEATAERIVSFATSFFGAYVEQNQDKSTEDALNEYMAIISEAIDTGFAEAYEILNSLSVFDGEIKENAEQTYDLVQDGLANFKEQQLSLLA